MDLLSEIRNALAEVKKNKAIKLKNRNKTDNAWIVRFDESFGVGILNTNNLVISERFSSVRLWNKSLIIEGNEINLLLLTSDDEDLRYEFASVCAEFCDPGLDGTRRSLIAQDPFAWWKKWKDLLGNTVKNKMPFAVLGEMVVLEQLIKKGEDVVWSGIKKATHDIESANESFEVKSTIKRYETTITVNSQHQLKLLEKDLNLIFCRFEPSIQGLTIDDMVKRLSSLGIVPELIESGLEKIGYESGCHDRKIGYKVHEIRQYKVNPEFPRINADSFVNGKIPKSITKIIYEVDLNGIDYINWTLC